MSLDFLREYGARRIQAESPQPLLLGQSQVLAPSDEPTLWDYEVEADAWRPLRTGSGDEHADSRQADAWALRPRRFIDGKDVGRTVAWLRSPQGYPVPVRLSQIGAVSMRAARQEGERDTLRLESWSAQRVVSLMVDFFPWDEVEAFARELSRRGFRLLPVEIPRSSPDRPEVNLFDFERMRKATYNRTLDEMRRLECEALASGPLLPVVVDGDLKPHVGAFDAAQAPVVGVVKSHSTNYLHAQGWRAFHDLKPGERTPAFVRQSEHLSMVSWYLRLGSGRAPNPNQGIVRVEIARDYFERKMGRDPAHLNAVSRSLRRLRCRNEDYNRAGVSIAPVVRAEETLGALFTPTETLTSRFYHMTGL